MRLEVDEPTEWQKRNKRWLADHPVFVALAGAAIFACLGSLLSSSGDTPSGLLIGIGLGALIGLGIGWGFSVEHREYVPRRLQVAVYAAGALGLVGFAILMAL